MADNLIVGLMMIVACVVIQCIVVSFLVRTLVGMERRQTIRATMFGTTWILIWVTLIMMAGNLLQMALWAELFIVLGEFEAFAPAFYHSVVNFATLGYGDIVMSERNRLLGGLEAANGVLMFGLTTSVLFTVLGALMRQAWQTRPGRDT